MLLHNELQRQGRLKALTWEDQVTGPTHNAIWTATALRKLFSLYALHDKTYGLTVNEIEYGKGTSTTRQGARDQAAMYALNILKEELTGRVKSSSRY